MHGQHNIAVKKEKRKIDHPSREPNRERWIAAGKKRLETMKFENDAQRRDYEHDVARSDHNVPGMPAFFPPKTIRAVMSRSVQTCVHCDEEIPGVGLFDPCPHCGYAISQCPHCKGVLYEGKLHDGTRFCRTCMEPLTEEVQ